MRQGERETSSPSRVGLTRGRGPLHSAMHAADAHAMPGCVFRDAGDCVLFRVDHLNPENAGHARTETVNRVVLLPVDADLDAASGVGRSVGFNVESCHRSILQGAALGERGGIMVQSLTSRIAAVLATIASRAAR